MDPTIVGDELRGREIIGLTNHNGYLAILLEDDIMLSGSKGLFLLKGSEIKPLSTYHGLQMEGAFIENAEVDILSKTPTLENAIINMGLGLYAILLGVYQGDGIYDKMLVTFKSGKKPISIPKPPPVEIQDDVAGNIISFYY